MKLLTNERVTCVLYVTHQFVIHLQIERVIYYDIQLSLKLLSVNCRH